jgi:hypothetical protein
MFVFQTYIPCDLPVKPLIHIQKSFEKESQIITKVFIIYWKILDRVSTPIIKMVLRRTIYWINLVYLGFCIFFQIVPCAISIQIPDTLSAVECRRFHVLLLTFGCFFYSFLNSHRKLVREYVIGLEAFHWDCVFFLYWVTWMEGFQQSPSKLWRYRQNVCRHKSVMASMASSILVKFCPIDTLKQQNSHKPWFKRIRRPIMYFWLT